MFTFFSLVTWKGGRPLSDGAPDCPWGLGAVTGVNRGVLAALCFHGAKHTQHCGKCYSRQRFVAAEFSQKFFSAQL